MSLKTCARCHNQFPPTSEHFTIDSYRKDGFSPYCRVCKRTKDRVADATPAARARRQQRRVAARNCVLEWYKLNLGCSICHETEPCCLQADHLDGYEKLYNVSIMCGKGLGLDLIKEELAKCRCLCANCHFKKTAKDFNWYKDTREDI